MQGMRPQWFSLAVLAIGLYWSSSIEGLKFVPIYEALTIKIHRESPPHVAFEEIYETSSLSTSTTGYHTVDLSNPNFKVITPKPQFELPAMTISRDKLNLSKDIIAKTATSSSNTAVQWRETLSSKQKARLDRAQLDKNILDQDWSPPSWTELATSKLKESGVMLEEYKSGVQIVAIDGQERSRPRVETGPIQTNPSGSMPQVAGVATVITGPVEITGGLAVTDDQHIELHRVSDGQIVDSGEVNPKEGTYTIATTDSAGDYVALLRTGDGSIIGRGTVPVAGFVAMAPKITINPIVPFSIAPISAYDNSVAEVAPAGTTVSFLSTETTVTVNKRGIAELANSVDGATTLARIKSKNHLQTNLLAISGQEMKAELFPDSMMRALVEIINSQKNMEYEGIPSIIWGRVKGLNKDGMAGIQVMLESAPYFEPVYFNDLMLPDLNLKATGSTGLFAFIGTSEGLHSLAAYREGQLYGYQNTVVEDGVVSVANIEISTKKQNSYIRVYDAFAGTPQESTLTVQALPADIIVNGDAAVETSQISRMGFVKSVPTVPDYLPSRYIFNELQKDIYVPLISWNWLNTVKNSMKFPDSPSAGAIIGFVPNQDYDIYIAGVEDISQHIVYFDAQGRVLQAPHGSSGGGFILFNLPPEVMEVVVIGKTSNKIDTRLVPVDSNSLTVLTFIAN